MTVCAFKAATGLPCPVCGLTRAHLALVRGDLRGAFYWHPLFALPWAALAADAVWRLVLRSHPELASDQSVAARFELLRRLCLGAVLGLWLARLIFRLPGVASRRW